MRGENEQQAAMYSYISPEQRVPVDHPLRPLRQMTDEIFKQLSPRFTQLYSRTGRPSIAALRLVAQSNRQALSGLYPTRADGTATPRRKNSAVKCSSESNSFVRANSSTAAKNSSAISPRNKRSRF